MPIIFRQKGNFERTERFLLKNSRKDFRPIFEKYGVLGVNELKANTPVDTGETRESWHYKVSKTSKGYSLTWYNTHMAGSIPVVILIQYGHATRGGTYVQGIDFVNPAIKPIFDRIAIELWKEVTRDE